MSEREALFNARAALPPQQNAPVTERLMEIGHELAEFSMPIEPPPSGQWGRSFLSRAVVVAPYREQVKKLRLGEIRKPGLLHLAKGDLGIALDVPRIAAKLVDDLVDLSEQIGRRLHREIKQYRMTEIAIVVAHTFYLIRNSLAPFPHVIPRPTLASKRKRVHH